MANAPLAGQDGGHFSFDLPDGLSEMFLREGLDGNLLICPSRLSKNIDDLWI